MYYSAIENKGPYRKKHKHNAYAYLIDNQLKFTIPSSSAPEIVGRK